MARNETKHMESALALSETLHFSRAAKKLGMSQPMLTKNIQDLEEILGGRIFDRNRKTVRLNEAGRAYLEQARLSLLYGERAFQAARAVMQDSGAILNVGRSPYSDPWYWSSFNLAAPQAPRLTKHALRSLLPSRVSRAMWSEYGRSCNACSGVQSQPRGFLAF